MPRRRIRTVLRNVRAAISCPVAAIDHDHSHRVQGYPVAPRGSQRH
jgi:hypothetical protein